MASTRGILADNLRALRIMHDLSQEDLASIAGVTRETVNKWESGAIGNIRNKNLDNIRHYFKLSIDDLRSETCGLASQLNKSNSIQSTMAPLVPLEWLADTSEHCTDAFPLIEIPAWVAANHPGCVVVEAPDDSMSRRFPAGAHILVDVNATCAELFRCEGPRIVIALDSGGSAVMRSLVVGGSTAILSSNSYEDNAKDVVLNVKSLRLLGTAVWYQAPHEL